MNELIYLFIHFILEQYWISNKCEHLLVSGVSCTRYIGKVKLRFWPVILHLAQQIIAEPQWIFNHGQREFSNPIIIFL